MRRFLAFQIAIGLLGFSVQASGQDQFIELMRSDLRADKVAILTEAMEFSEEDANTFWPIYREYELELSKLGDRRIALLKRYAALYFGRVEKALSATIAARFLQVEHQIMLLAELGMASETPLVEPVKR